MYFCENKINIKNENNHIPSASPPVRKHKNKK